MTEAQAIPSPVDGVTALERKFKSKANRQIVTQRLYSRADGFALGAVRGGPLHMADETSWEIFTMNNGIKIGESTGWISDAELDRIVGLLATWGRDAA